MKIIRYKNITLLTLVVFFSGFSMSAQKAGMSEVCYKDTITLEQVSFDSQTYNQLKADKNFDYYHTQPQGLHLGDTLREVIFRWLRKYFDPDISQGQVDAVLWILAAIFVILIIVVIYFFKPSLFYINKKKKTSFSVEDEDIHELNFDKLIKESLDSEAYSDAIRWTYLHSLKLMQDRGYISWEPNKTVNEYVYEMKRLDLKPEFTILSREFLYFRYGNFDASKESYIRFSSLNDQLVKYL